jgi:hypothetical protein
MSMGLPKHFSNIVLGILGILALIHSLLYFGTGEVPEAILGLLLGLNGCAERKQPAMLVPIAVAAIALTWIGNSTQAISSQYKAVSSWIAMALFALLAFSRYIFNRSSTHERGDAGH